MKSSCSIKRLRVSWFHQGPSGNIASKIRVIPSRILFRAGMQTDRIVHVVLWLGGDSYRPWRPGMPTFPQPFFMGRSVTESTVRGVLALLTNSIVLHDTYVGTKFIVKL